MSKSGEVTLTDSPYLHTKHSACAAQHVRAAWVAVHRRNCCKLHTLGRHTQS